MALELKTSGIKVGYLVETTASSTHPTGAYTNISGIKSIPDFNPTPSAIDVTDLSDSQYKRYITGLTDVGGALGFGANFTKAFATTWASLVSAYETGATSGKSTWFEISVPSFGKFYFAGIPQDLGLPAVEVDSVFAGEAYITPNKIEGWALD